MAQTETTQAKAGFNWRNWLNIIGPVGGLIFVYVLFAAIGPSGSVSGILSTRW